MPGAGPRPSILRKGAIVSVPRTPGHWTTAQAFVDLLFDDGHVDAGAALGTRVSIPAT